MTWRGHQQVHQAPAAFAVRRTMTVNEAAFVSNDVRTSDWYGRCPWLTAAILGTPVAAAASARALIKKLSVRLVSGTGLEVADDNDFGGAANNMSADSGSPVIVLLWPGEANRNTWEWKTSGAVTVEVELWFDVPPVSGRG